MFACGRDRSLSLPSEGKTLKDFCVTLQIPLLNCRRLSLNSSFFHAVNILESFLAFPFVLMARIMFGGLAYTECVCCGM